MQEIDGSMAQLTSALAARTVERDRVHIQDHPLQNAFKLVWINIACLIN
jgi:hypothetical protein